MDPKHPDIHVTLTGADGNAFSIIAKVSRALKHHGIDPSEFREEAMSGDYDNVLQTCMRWVDVS